MKNNNKKVPIWFKILVILLLLISVLMMYSLISSDNDTNKIYSNSSKKFGEFAIYNGKAYVAVPSNGYLEVPDADNATLKLLTSDIIEKQIAIDKNNVYCGNLILPNLNPKTTHSIGNNYYSDSNLTYYCGSGTRRNDIKWWEEIWQILRFSIFGGKKPQTYWYPFKLLPKSNYPYLGLSLVDKFTPIASDGKLAYYRGDNMPDANPNSLRALGIVYVDGDIRESLLYFADGKNVFYQNKKLPLTDNSQLYTFYIEGMINDEQYLFNPTDGMVYINEITFNPQYAPYKVISKHGNHINQTLFLSREGVFYYDYKEEMVKRAGENPFLQSKYIEIAPLVFSDGKQLLYVEDSENWSHTKNGRRLQSRSTHIYKLNEPQTSTWEKLGKLSSGTLWKNGNNYYYFDELGSDQLILHTIYKILNKATAESMLQADQNINIRKRISNLIEDKKLIPVEHKEIIEAKTKMDLWY